MKAKTPVQRNVFYIPAGVPFLNALARAVLSGALPKVDKNPPEQVDLPRWTILLPTRRATRALMQAFIEEGDGTARLLPRIQPLGDVDEDELTFSELFPDTGEALLPDAISGLERQFILFDLIHNWVREFKETPLARMLTDCSVHAFDLAQSLATLVDNFETNIIDLKVIENLFDGEFAGHRQQLLGFLAIVQKQLPERMAAIGKIGSNARRNLLMQAHTTFLARGEAPGPVIAAGSTGSIPATAELLSCISGMKNGAVILPGLDVSLDNDSWDCLPENHPQFGMRELLGKMNIDRADVSILPGITESATGRAKNWLASEITRPAETTDQWRQAVTKSRETLIEATGDITILDAEDQRHESLAIALIMRNGLETGSTVALVTPDRQLARNVKSELARWKIEIDDSAGEPLIHSPHAGFLRLLLEAAKSRFSPLTLKSLLFHPFSCFATPPEHRMELFNQFEVALLRSGTAYDGLTGLNKLCTKYIESPDEDPYAHPAFKRLQADDWQAISGLCERLTEILQPLDRFTRQAPSSTLSELITCHLEVAEAACQSGPSSPDLWGGDAGEKLFELFAGMQAAAHLAPVMTGNDYAMLIDQQMAQSILRPRHVRHGSLAIYGLLEARLISADIFVLGGLNETIWPPVAEVDPWLTRPQLRDAGLPVPERRIGLTAHDFAQGFCAEKLYLTYSKKRDNSPAVPSRWILRLEALLIAADAQDTCQAETEQPWLEWALLLDRPNSFEPTRRPAPKPPLDLRPVNFSISGIGTLMKDPYAFFADKILNLKPLDSLDRRDGAAERGNLVHAGLQNFVHTYRDQLPENAGDVLFREFEQLAENTIPDTALRVFWRPQFSRMAEWFIDQEIDLRTNLQTSFLEISGQYSFQIKGTDYQLSAKADRVDLLDDQTARIIDYKTGTVPALKETNKEFSPQLLLEAVISTHGGFNSVEAAPVSYLAYMKLSGGVPAGETTSLIKDVDTQVEKSEVGMRELLATYAQFRQPYLANSQPVRIDVEYEYDFLSRWREWAHLATGEAAP